MCRKCHLPSIFQASQLRPKNSPVSTITVSEVSKHGDSLNDLLRVDGYVSIKDDAHNHQSPELLGPELAAAYNEGATCLAVGCYNAASTMFRRCLDIVTRPLLPDEADRSTEQPNQKQRRDLGLRLQWLLDQDRLSPALRELAKCIREDGNDAAHLGGLTREDAEDIQDFTFTLLDRLVIEPKKLTDAEERRKVRRGQ